MSNYNHFKTAEFLNKARQKFLKEQDAESTNAKLKAIEESTQVHVDRHRSISNANDKRIIANGLRMQEVTKIDREKVRLNVFTEAVCKYILPAIPIEESYRAAIKPVVFNTVRGFLSEQVKENPNFLNELSEKTCILENMMDRVDIVTDRLIKRFNMVFRGSLSEADATKDNVNPEEEMSYDKMNDDPVALLHNEEDDILSPENSDDGIVGAGEINEIIANKVVAVVEDEKARAEEHELVIQDIKDSIAEENGELPEGEELPTDEEIAEAVLANIGTTFFQNLLTESQMEKINKNILEGLGAEETESSLMEAVIRYTIAETLHTLRIYEPKSRTKY